MDSTAEALFELITLKSGYKSLRSLEHGETFHPVTGPRAEANILHVRQQHLVERARERSPFIIWDVGFGAAANALAAVEALLPTPAQVELHSFDRSLAPIAFALQNSEALGYLHPFRQTLETLTREGFAQPRPGLSWRLHLDDFATRLHDPALPAPDAILYDPYSPTQNPGLWTLAHFSGLRARLDDSRPCLLSNYTRSTAVRVTWLMAGFYVGRGCEVGEKAETTLASNCPKLIENPLGPDWLLRVRRSLNAAPLRDSVYRKAAITAEDLRTLEAHPQFSAPGGREIAAP